MSDADEINFCNMVKVALMIIACTPFMFIVTANYILTSFTDCGNESSDMHLISFKIVKVIRPNMTIAVAVIFDNDIHINDLYVVLSSSRCQIAEAPDTCLIFRDFKTTQTCAVLFSKTFSMRMILKCLKIDSCLAKAGKYHTNHCVIDTSRHSLIPMGNYYWKVKAQLYHKRSNRLSGCALMQLHGI